MNFLHNYIILSCFVILSSFHLSAHTAYNKILNLQYHEAKLELNKETELAENIYLNALNEFVYYLATGDTAISFNFIAAYPDRIKELQHENDYENQAFEGEIDFMLSLIYFSQSNYIKSAIPAYKAYRRNRKLLIDYPDEKLHLKMSGIIQLISVVIPKEFAWILNLTGMKGSMDQGFKFLEEYKLYEKKKFGSSLLSSVIISVTQGIFFNDYENANKSLLHQDDQNQVIVFLKARNYSKLGLNDKAIAILENYLNENEEIELSFLYYQLGSALLYKLDEEANLYLTAYLEKSKYDIFKRSVCLKLAWYYKLFQENERFDNCLQNFYRYQLSYNETDQQATLEMDNIATYDVNMLKSRLLFDGGYYTDALHMLHKVDKSNLLEVPQKIEYLYRYARVYHKLNDIDKAVKYYENTIAFGHAIPLYYAAFSAMQLGLIYEEKNDIKNAVFYYKYCLTINKNQYKNTIEYQVNAGLNRISNLNSNYKEPN